MLSLAWREVCFSSDSCRLSDDADTMHACIIEKGSDRANSKYEMAFFHVVATQRVSFADDCMILSTSSQQASHNNKNTSIPCTLALASRVFSFAAILRFNGSEQLIGFVTARTVYFRECDPVVSVICTVIPYIGMMLKLQ